MSKNKLVTVLGPKDPHELGVTDAHGHLWITDLGLADSPATVIDQPDLVVNELEAYQRAGGSAILDCQPGGCGRNANQLHAFARRTGVQIVACTGFHLQEYYPPGAVVWKLDADQALDYFLGEIRLGLEETRRSPEPVTPGFIKIAVRETLGSSPQALVEAALRASQESGLLIEMHTQGGKDAEEFVNWFDQLGFPLDRLVICHIDKRPDIGLHQFLAQAGCLLEYDTFFRPKYHPEENLWPLLLGMVGQGYAQSIACATDLADPNMWRNSSGGPGYPGFIEIVKARLDSEICDPALVGKLVGGNIINRLAH